MFKKSATDLFFVNFLKLSSPIQFLISALLTSLKLGNLIVSDEQVSVVTLSESVKVFLNFGVKKNCNACGSSV